MSPLDTLREKRPWVHAPVTKVFSIALWNESLYVEFRKKQCFTEQWAHGVIDCRYKRYGEFESKGDWF